MEKFLKLGETHANQTSKPQDVQISFLNAMGYRGTSFQTLHPGESITKTHSETVIHIFINN